MCGGAGRRGISDRTGVSSSPGSGRGGCRRHSGRLFHGYRRCSFRFAFRSGAGSAGSASAGYGACAGHRAGGSRASASAGASAASAGAGSFDLATDKSRINTIGVETSSARRLNWFLGDRHFLWQVDDAASHHFRYRLERFIVVLSNRGHLDGVVFNV